MSTHDQIRSLFEEAIETTRRSLGIVDEVARSAAVLIEALKAGRKILVCGNGGSAADAQHFAAELVGRFERQRRAIPAIALTTDSSILTAWSNDYAFESVFSRQVEALGSAGDVLIGISTSGSSPSILRAMEEGSRRGMHLVALTGRGGGELTGLKNVHAVIVPSDVTSRIQEVHIKIIHIWARLIEAEMA
jgi:D-sedoheptulose 7-phosphate isomerase